MVKGMKCEKYVKKKHGEVREHKEEIARQSAEICGAVKSLRTKIEASNRS